jgi:hypothetical protein
MIYYQDRTYTGLKTCWIFNTVEKATGNLFHSPGVLNAAVFGYG